MEILSLGDINQTLPLVTGSTLVSQRTISFLHSEFLESSAQYLKTQQKNLMNHIKGNIDVLFKNLKDNNGAKFLHNLVVEMLKKG